MKRILIPVLLLIVSVVSIEAAVSKVTTTFQRKENNKKEDISRSPFRMPVNIFFDDETNRLDIVAEPGVNATVEITDETGRLIASSPTLSCSYSFPADYTGIVTIQLLANDWTGTAELYINL